MTTGRINQVNGATHESCREAQIREATMWNIYHDSFICKYEFTNPKHVRCRTNVAELTWRKHFVKRPCHQGNAQASNATPCKCMALEKRTPNTTHPRSSRIAPAWKRRQFNQARRDAKTSIREVQKKKKNLPLFEGGRAKKKRTLHRWRVPPYTHHLMTAFWHQRWFWICVSKKWTNFRCVLWPHTHRTVILNLEWHKKTIIDDWTFR